jgi:hypothetical protein
MEPGYVALQDRVVNAFLDQFEDDPDWTIGFVHADFSDASGDFGPVCKAFLVRRQPDPERPDYVPLQWATIEALIGLQKGYASNDEAFDQLDLEIEAGDGRYRFQFYRDTAPPAGGSGSRSGAGHLMQCYREILARS